MSEPIEESYFNWLRAKVLSPTNMQYQDLLRELHRTEFVWLIPGDRNRAEDGLELRLDFGVESRLDPDPEWQHIGCSILEMLFAFAKRASFQTDNPPKDWFWEFITNLDLGELRHVLNEDDILFVDDVLQKFIWRTYDPSGLGGMFPMRWPKQDQTKVEIWYQFCEYLDDQGRL